jgi:hypothetical protein
MLRGQAKITRQRGNPHRKLSAELVVKLRELNELGVCLTCAIRVLNLGVSYSTAWNAANYATWKNVE